MTAAPAGAAPPTSPGPLDGMRVVELSSEHAAFAGRLLAGLGAEVVVVEPPGGDPSRGHGPFAGDIPGPERSLWWWHYNVDKLGVVLDLADRGDTALFTRLVGAADIVLEGEQPARLADLGLDHPKFRADRPELVWVSITPFGREGPRSTDEATDLTVLAGGGPVWSCGYDDHSLPPVRGGGNQGYQTACLWAVATTLVAVLHRELTGRGQHLDVSMHAAANVTTEAATYEWLVARATVQRQTGRHASVHPTRWTRSLAADGRDVQSGFPPRTAAEFQAVLDWMDELGIAVEMEERFWLEIGRDRGEIHLSEIGHDVEATEIFGAGRDAVSLIASHLPADEFFVGAQSRGLACGVVYAPEEVMQDRHFAKRGFPVEIEHEDLGRSFVYPGAPLRLGASPWRPGRRAPHIGEHQSIVLDALNALE